jgi:hypothetical protein
MNKFFSLSLGLVLFSGPLMSTISNYLGIDIYLQFIVLLAWILIFIVKNNIKIYSNIVELITANKLLSLLLVTMYIGMVVQINPYLIFENFINLFSKEANLNVDLDQALILANIYYFDLAVRFIAISLLFILVVQDISNLRNFFIGLALVTILTAIIALGIHWENFMILCNKEGFVGFQLPSVNRADLAYKLALAFSVLYIYAIRRINFNTYFLIFFNISTFMMMISGGKGGMLIYILLMVFLAYKKNEVRLMFISFFTFILALVLLSYTNICDTSVYIEQNKTRLIKGVEARLTLIEPQINKPLDQLEINESNNAIAYSSKYEGTLFKSGAPSARSASGTHNFFIDLYRNFSIFSFLLILVPLFLIIGIASLRCYKDNSKVYFDTKLIFIAVLAVTFFSFTFSSYLSRNILFPLVVSLAYLIANIKTTKQSNHDHE